MSSEWKGCFYCEHFSSKENNCKAFPKGIPLPFVSGERPHFDVISGQEGSYVYQEKQKKK